MKFLLFVALFAISAPCVRAISTQDELIDAAKDADSIVCIRIYAQPNPRVDVISVWKPNDNISEEVSIRQSVNTFILQHPSLNPPKYDCAFLLISKFPKGDFNGPAPFVQVSAIDIEDKSLLFGGHKLDLQDTRKLILKSLKSAQQDAAANP